MTNRVINR